MGPRSTLRRLGEISRRRPLLGGVVACGLLLEAARVSSGIRAGGLVALVGHSGLERWDPAVDAVWLWAYAVWVGGCGLVLLVAVARGASER